MGILKLYHSVSVKTAMFFITAFVFVFQETRRQALKPPILVVPYKTSDLICFITRDEEEDDTDSSQVRSKRAKKSQIFKKCAKCKRENRLRESLQTFITLHKAREVGVETKLFPASKH